MQPDEEFVEQIRDFLAHLYEHGYLQKSELVSRLASRGSRDGRQAMRDVRSLVLEVLEQMNPGPKVPFRSPRAQAYNILKLHYVEGLTVQEVARELMTSERTLYRDLRKAEQDLAAMLSSHLCPEAALFVDSGQSVREEPLLEEAQRVGSSVKEVHLWSFLQGALAAVERLSQLRNMSVEARLSEGSEVAYTDPSLARQVIISILSQAIQHSQAGGSVTVQASCLGGKVEIELAYRPVLGVKIEDLFPIAARQLVGRLGGQWTATTDTSGLAHVICTLGDQPRCTVLVIDDNENLVQLFQRYLADANYHLIAARDGQEGLRLAEQIAPDVVILDIMMPQNDGWEVLQWFQTQVHTHQIPVVICSVLNDPELAFSLGATDFLEKPVTRASLIKALSRFRTGTPPRSDPASPAHIG
jgi:CheY-like chemotaxis protein